MHNAHDQAPNWRKQLDAIAVAIAVAVADEQLLVVISRLIFLLID